jgi:hypothetical protein
VLLPLDDTVPLPQGQASVGAQCFMRRGLYALAARLAFCCSSVSVGAPCFTHSV